MNWIRAHRQLLRWITAAAFVALIAWYLSQNSDQLSILLEMDLRILLFLVVCYVVYLAVDAWRLLVIMRFNGLHGITFGEWFRLFVVARFLNQYVPQAGNVYRGSHLKTSHQFSYTGYTSSLASSVWLRTILDMLLAVILIGILDPNMRIGTWRASIVVGAVLAVVIVGPVILHLLTRGIDASSGRLARVHKALTNVLSTSVGNISDVRFALPVSLLSMLTFAIITIVFFLALRMLNVAVTVPVVAIFVCLRRASQVASITPGNVGVAELAYGFLGFALGVGMVPGILASSVVRMVGYMVCGAMGILFGGISLLKNSGELSDQNCVKESQR